MNKLARIVYFTLIAGVIYALSLCLYRAGFRNVQDVRSIAHGIWKPNGYTVVAYEGYKWSIWHGGLVYYVVIRNGDPSITYEGALGKWGDDEYHIYNLRAIDSIHGSTKP